MYSCNSRFIHLFIPRPTSFFILNSQGFDANSDRWAPSAGPRIELHIAAISYEMWRLIRYKSRWTTGLNGISLCFSVSVLERRRYGHVKTVATDHSWISCLLASAAGDTLMDFVFTVAPVKGTQISVQNSSVFSPLHKQQAAVWIYTESGSEAQEPFLLSEYLY